MLEWDDGQENNEYELAEADASLDSRIAAELEQEREQELEIQLEDDQLPPVNDEEQPPEKKRLKRELEREALIRLEDAARTPEDFSAIIDWWDRLDRNRERRERDHEVGRSDIPLEYRKSYDGLVFPAWLNNPAQTQLSSGNFLDVLFDCPYEMHELTADAFLSKLVLELKEDHKEILYFLAIRLYSSTMLASIRGQTDRNIRKVRGTIIRKLQKKLYQQLNGKRDKGMSLTLQEQEFLAGYEKSRP